VLCVNFIFEIKLDLKAFFIIIIFKIPNMVFEAVMSPRDSSVSFYSYKTFNKYSAPVSSIGLPCI